MPTTPTVGLTALSIITPIIGTGANTVSVDATALALVINADANTTQIEVLAGTTSTVLTSPTDVGGLHQFTGLIPIPDSVTLQLTGRNYDPTNPDDPNVNNPLLTPTVQFDAVYVESQDATLIGPPSGITVYRGGSNCTVEWAIPSYPGFLGVRVQYSTDPSGVTVPYTQLSASLFTEVTRSLELPVGSTNTSVVTVPSNGAPGYDYTTTSTTTSQTKATNFSSAAIPYSTVSSDTFYVLLTNVIQDVNTQVVYESQAAGPIQCGFVDLTTVGPTDFLALQRSTDIATRLTTNLTQRLPNLDLTARAEARDIIINPLALELALMSLREWFSRIFSSISALSQLDDSNGDGISDPVETSTIKQQVAQAYGLDFTTTQTFIDSRFDVLGEAAGVTRGGPTAATVTLTFYTLIQPTSNLVVNVGAVVSTIPDSSGTSAVSFTTTSSAILDASNPSAYYDPTNNWWFVNVSAQCNTAGSVGAVGANAIQQTVSGTPAGASVTNLLATDNGTDGQSNSDYAAAIRNRQITGIDSSTQGGYYDTARKVPGVIDAIVIPAGNTDMLRDWDPIRQKHVFGCVDIYVQGNTVSQQINTEPFTYPSPSTYGTLVTYLPLSVIDTTKCRLKVTNFSSLTQPIYTTVEIAATSAGVTLYLGTTHAQFDNTAGIVTLDPTENVYQRNADGTTSIWQVNGVNSTNASFLQSAAVSNVVYGLMPRSAVGVQYVPPLQPLVSITSVTGPQTGTIPSSVVQLVRTNDFLLTGGSNDAGDQVVVAATSSSPQTVNITLTGSPMLIDSAMDIGIDGNGQPENVLSVRSADLSTLYTFGVDYTIIPYARYHAYALKILTNPTTGEPSISNGSTVVVAYNKFDLYERLTPVTDTITLSSNLPGALSTAGFVQNVWIPESYGNTTLSQDSGLIAAGVDWADRYIKATYTSGGTTTVLIPGQDYTLSVANNLASLTRIVGGAIPDGASISVQYFTVEILTVTTNYPAYVEQVAQAVAITKSACADVLVKAMVANPVDLTFTVNLDSSTSATTADSPIRTALTILLNNAETKITMSQIVACISGVSGVTSVNLPLQKCAKSDGSYSIGEVIPTGTDWVGLSTDPAFKTTPVPPNTFITAAPVLENSTIPSGGQPDAYVGLLYENEAYRRASSVQDFLSGASPSFYFIGTNDYLNASTPFDSTYPGRIMVTVPSTLVTPALNAYRATYQVYGEAGATDIAVSSTEYLTPGTITIVYAGS